jgi:RimJ/RimL family protein N-acetyltransferase
MSLVPTLHTRRLTLRPMVSADFPAYATMMASARAQGMGGPFDERAAWGIFCHEIACWPLFGHGGLTVVRNDSGDAIGVVEINAGPLFPEPELGWQLYEGHEGQGFATEAARALRDWAFATLPLQSLVSYTGPENLASQAVARRLGAVIDPDAPVQDVGDIVWRHLRGLA